MVSTGKFLIFGCVRVQQGWRLEKPTIPKSRDLTSAGHMEFDSLMLKFSYGFLFSEKRFPVKLPAWGDRKLFYPILFYNKTNAFARQKPHEKHKEQHAAYIFRRGDFPMCFSPLFQKRFTLIKQEIFSLACFINCWLFTYFWIIK